MTTAEARTHLNEFGYLEANGDKYPKAIHGRIVAVENKCLEFIGNEGEDHIFYLKNVHSFVPMEFKGIEDGIPDE